MTQVVWIQTVYAGGGMGRRRKGNWRVNEGYVNTVLRKDGTVVTITPTGSNYDLAIDGEHRTIGPEMASDPLNDPAFETIVQELKKDLERQCQTVSPAHQPLERH